MVQVVQAMLDLTRESDLVRLGKPNVPPSSVSMEAVVQQVRHNRRKERASQARDSDSGTAMEEDTPSGTPGGTPSGVIQYAFLAWAEYTPGL